MILVSPGISVGDVRFGMSRADVIEVLGHPKRTARMGDTKGYPRDGERWEYENFSLLFAHPGSVVCVELERPAAPAILWQRDIFEIHEIDLIRLLLELKISFDVEPNQWGEVEIHTREPYLSFFFQDAKLESLEVSRGKLVSILR